ncbi:hypothetical protein AgCh_039832 [Apium graveolens]
MANSISILMLAVQIVKSIVSNAVTKDTRMAASLLRLYFHDCFVKGCDASILLDSSSSIINEKGSNPNRNSVCGFDVIDQIKSTLERECPQTVSCVDIMALDARDSTVLTGGPSWEVLLGRRDSRCARLSGSNYNIPAPNNTFQTILTKFKLQGLDIVDLVALSVVVLPKAIYLVSEIFTLCVTCSGKAAYRMMKQMAGNPTKWEGRRVLFIHTGRLPCTCMARSGKLDPVIGRDDEIRRCILILSRRTKNNHVLKYRNWS